jgi:hypothetical protein
MTPSAGSSAAGPATAPEISRAAGGLRRGLELFVLSFLALFLELMIIRWAPSVVRLVAYYANLMLISSFLGLGVGAMIGGARRSLLPWLPSLLGASVACLLVAQYATLPSTASEYRFYARAPRLLNYASLIAIFASNALVFVPLGQRIGILFESMPRLRAYSWDLGGSLAGTLCFGLFSFWSFSPVAGMAFVVALIVILLPRSRWLSAILLLATVVGIVLRSNDPNAIWSPYYHVTVRAAGPSFTFVYDQAPTVREPVAGLRTMLDPPTYVVSVNHDFYQPHGTLDPNRYSPAARPKILEARSVYDLPYALAPAHRRVLVLGAGGGTDAEVALLNGADQVDAVEIDPVLVELSRRFNASGVYRDPRVRVHVEDARAFLRRARGGYDMVLFGWLDSQALFSSMSNLRLDGYIYTVESIRTAYRLLGADGTLCLSFLVGPEWLARKLVRMVAEATGIEPIVYHGGSKILICAPRGRHLDPPATYGPLARVRIPDRETSPDALPPTDDWPFLYLAGRRIPADYLAVIGSLLAISLVSVFMVRGRGFTLDDGHFLFLGLGFLLLETRSIGDCSLYFGATWFVTLVIVAGVLLMVLGANLVAMRLEGSHLRLYLPLFASLLIVGAVPRDLVLSLGFGPRLLWSLVAVPLPIFFAGLIFSTTFRDAGNPSARLGANLIGAMIGGFCEYLGMATGNRSLMLLVIGAYVLSLVCRAAVSRRGFPIPPTRA